MNLLKRAEKRDGKYENPVPTQLGGLKLALKVLPMYFRNREETEPKQPLGPFVTDASTYKTPPASGLRVTWFGHSAMLLEIDGVRVLIDPIWEERASPVQFFGPKRFFAPTLPLTALPDLDVILVSHDHYDHFGAATLKRLAELPAASDALWVTSLGVEKRLARLGVPEVHIAALDWTGSVNVGAGLTITEWPSRHFSGRSLGDRMTTLWGSFVLEGPHHRVFYGADSGYWDGFAQIAARYDRFDLTMLEIGAWNELWEDIHLGPDGAARAYEAMRGAGNPGLLMPIHWGLFSLAPQRWKQPIERMLEVAQEQNIPLWLPSPGVPTEVLSEEPAFSLWWK